ncbi:MAG: DUF1304 domain-containing protein [Lautropia sp.]|nr:DUF1304 domain-containing protein [Lautropia sp.]
MSGLAMGLVVLVMLEHLFILWMEMFSWERTGRKVFTSLSPELFGLTRAMAANQGLYNGFLVAGLLWSLLIADPVWQCRVATFFLGCVLTAGAYGGITVGRKIFLVQGLPALLGLLVLLL